MESLKLSERIDQHFPLPKSNRGFKSSAFINTLILNSHQGNFRLDDVPRLKEDNGLLTVLEHPIVPSATAMGDWLRRMGRHCAMPKAWVSVNRALLQSALHQCKNVTLDIDASEIVANKAGANWTYNKNKGFMPMVGHIAQTGQVVAVDFRHGNVPPNANNLAFIKQCQQSLPEDCRVQAVRIDAAGYQAAIIEYCDQQQIDYAIRAKSSAAMREQIEVISDKQWQPLLDHKGKTVKDQHTCRTSFCIGDYEQAFTLIIQRTRLEGQASLDLEDPESAELIEHHGYLYRAIATNRDYLSDSELIHWYNQRAEDSENRIKELKLDFGGNQLPCTDFQANQLYFLITALSYNLFALMRSLLPEKLAQHRAMTIRWRLYAIAAKVVKTGRQVFVKLKAPHCHLLKQVLSALRRFNPPPI